MKKIIFLIFGHSCIITTCLGQMPQDGPSQTALNLYKQDLKIFRDSMEHFHPALYRYTSKTELDRLFDNCYAGIGADMTKTKFFMTIKSLMSAVKDGHLNSSLPRDIVRADLAQAKVFPLRLWFTEKGAFVYCSADSRFAAGSEIISIDNRPVKALRDTLFRYLLSDGSILSKKYVYLNSGEGTFQFFYYWLFGSKEKFNVVYKNAKGIITSSALDAALIRDNKCFFESAPAEKYFSLDIKTNDIAMLTVKTFDINKLGDDEQGFGKLLDSAFNVINEKKIKKLIIDVRDNGGGEDSYGALLYSYLTDKPFSYYRSIETVFSKFPKTAHSNLEIQYPQRNNFKGKCYFLINGKSFSTTSEFCAIAKSNKRGTFVGEETGGGYYGNTGGDQVRFTLPFSGISIFIPKRKYTLEVKKQPFTDRGVIPDHAIVPSIVEVLEKKDVQLEFVLKLIGQKFP